MPNKFFGSLPRIKDNPEIAGVYCAITNPIEILIIQTQGGQSQGEE